MTTRITGLATGLDVDTLVKQTMQAYQTKIDTQQQKKDVLEIKQQLYRDVIKEAQELYNKHFDVLKEGSLIKSSTWQSVKFTSSNSNLTVTGTSSAKIGNYTIEKGSTIAKAATITKTESELGDKITINGQEFSVTGSTTKEKADNLNTALTKAGINVTVKYTNFAGNSENKEAFVFESKTLGKDSGFAIGGTKTTLPISQGKDAIGAKITGLTVYDLKSKAVDNKVSFTINNKDFTIDIANGSTNKEVESILNDKLKESGYTSSIDDLGRITLTTTATGKGQIEINSITIEGVSKKVTFQDGENSTVPEAIDITSYINESNGQILINGVVIDLSNKNSLDDKVNYINEVLQKNNITINAKIAEGNKITLESNVEGSSSKIEFSQITENEIVTGEDANIIVNNGSGTYTYTYNSNTFSLDGITFKFTGEIPTDGISVTSKQDSSEIVDNIKKYIEDYNSLIEKINTLTSEKRDRDYQPLTDAQKEEMSENEIELWEAKVKKGQLRRDSDLMRISNALKQGMRSMVSGSGLSLEDIGIESVQDYGGTKDGTFKIDETTLKEAIENNTENVAKLFTQSSTSTTSDAYNQKGIMIRLKETLYDETVSSKSILSKKVGFEGTTTVSNNTLTKQMEEYQKKIDDMEELFDDKEQALYTKYSKLETIINNYNNQMTYLSQSLGLSTS